MFFSNFGLRCIQILIASALFLNPLYSNQTNVSFEHNVKALKRDQTNEELANSLRDLHKSMKQQGFEMLSLIECAMTVREQLTMQYGIEITTEQFEHICDLLRGTPNIPIEKASHHKNKKKKEKEVKFPARVIGGFLKILAGSLLFIIPFPVTNVAGGMLIGNGLCDLVDGCVDEEKKKEEFP